MISTRDWHKLLLKPGKCTIKFTLTKQTYNLFIQKNRIEIEQTNYFCTQENVQ